VAGHLAVVAAVISGILHGGANAINSVVDRDIDAQWSGPSAARRPTRSASAGRSPLGWCWRGWVRVAVLLRRSSPPSRHRRLIFYVVVYTMLLKRTTPQNIVIGGAAGAVPALVGWAAVTGTLALPAWILFAVVFFWTPPHFWALALRFQDDYARAGIPMLPVVHGERMTILQIALYSAVVGAVSLLLVPAADLGGLYLWSAVTLGLARQRLRDAAHRPESVNGSVSRRTSTWPAVLGGDADVLL
jgi:protoheme IX farnesyltransferase